jgi:hypothetical protein
MIPLLTMSPLTIWLLEIAKLVSMLDAASSPRLIYPPILMSVWRHPFIPSSTNGPPLIFISDHVLVYSNGLGQIIYVFAEANGYSQEPWNMPQDAVMSHLLTFLNHGCNGTSNMGDDAATLGITEFSIDLERCHRHIVLP